MGEAHLTVRGASRNKGLPEGPSPGDGCPGCYFSPWRTRHGPSPVSLTGLS